jgi:AraC-like DNA-binding protein
LEADSEDDLKLEAIARSVGFAEAAAFSKAFKPRKGCTPIEYRRRRERGAAASAR